MFQTPESLQHLDLLVQAVTTAAVGLPTVILGMKLSLNGMGKNIKDLKDGQGEVKATLQEHGERLARVETKVELNRIQE